MESQGEWEAGMPSELTELIGLPPEPISFRIADIPAGTHFPSRKFPWGKLLYSISGVVQLTIEGKLFLSPPAYAIWIPPDIEHYSSVNQDICYAALYVESSRCSELPDQACTLLLSSIFKAITADLEIRCVNLPLSSMDKRLADVLIDQLQLAPRFDSYLPLSNTPEIASIITALQLAPGDRRALGQWAEIVGTTERTLSRWWKAETGISFHEWRQRLKLTTALSLLDRGVSVEEIARRLSYNNASAFIAMFHQFMGSSPDRMRRAPRDGA